MLDLDRAGHLVVSHRRDIRTQRIAHTADIIAAFSTSERLADSSFQMTKLINDGARLSMKDIDPDIEAHVVNVLDYYEFLCDLYAKKVIDRRTIVQLRGRLMRRTGQVCEAYIKETGERQNRRVYDGFENFVMSLPPDDSPAFISMPTPGFATRVRDGLRRLIPASPKGAGTDPAHPSGSGTLLPAPSTRRNGEPGD